MQKTGGHTLMCLIIFKQHCNIPNHVLVSPYIFISHQFIFQQWNFSMTRTLDMYIVIKIPCFQISTKTCGVKPKIKHRYINHNERTYGFNFIMVSDFNPGPNIIPKHNTNPKSDLKWYTRLPNASIIFHLTSIPLFIIQMHKKGKLKWKVLYTTFMCNKISLYDEILSKNHEICLEVNVNFMICYGVMFVVTFISEQWNENERFSHTILVDPFYRKRSLTCGLFFLFHGIWSTVLDCLKRQINNFRFSSYDGLKFYKI